MVSIKMFVLVTCFRMNISEFIQGKPQILMVGNKRCITNGSSALAIIKDIHDTNEESDNKVSSYYPHSPILCSFDKNNECGSKNWIIVGAMDGPINSYVTDRRWETFPLTKTNSDVGYKNVLQIHDFKIFSIPLSIRIGQDEKAEIFLSEGFDVRNSNTYRIILDFRELTQTSLLKCTKRLYRTPSCENKNVHIEAFLEPLNGETWAHFLIERDYKKIKILRGKTDFITYGDDDRNTFDTKYLIVSSKEDTLWKLHNYDYLITEKTHRFSEQIGSSQRITNSTTCISMFLAMCKTCCLTLILEFEEGGEIREDVSTRDDTWNEFKLVFDTRNHIGSTFAIFLYRHVCDDESNHSEKGLFWAIDDIRLCEEQEYRYIESEDEYSTCQQIGLDRTETVRIDETIIPETGISCPENTFGDFCVPCGIFGKEWCEQFAYCDVKESKKHCHCTAGYEGRRCEKQCIPGYYGHGCQKECSKHCSKGSCAPKSGVCAGGVCDEPYTPPKCEKPSVILFKKPPKVGQITPTSGLVTIEDFAIETPETVEEPEFYSIEYAEDPDQSENRTGRKENPVNWNVTKHNLKYGTENSLTIDNLKPDTYYKVRATVTQDDQKKGNYIKYTRFVTACTEITEDDVTITADNASAIIYIKWPPNSCKFDKYQIIFANDPIYTPSDKPRRLMNLQPFTQYYLTIRLLKSGKDIHKEFWTKEGAPSKVQNVTYTRSSDLITLYWKIPQYTRGNIIRYDIDYYCVKPSGNSQCINVSNYSKKTSQQTSINLRNLKPYSTYQIQIYGITSGGEGEKYSTLIETKELDYLTDAESLAPEGHKAFSDSVQIFVTKLGCEDLMGNIFLMGNASCSNEWCTGKTVSKSIIYSINSPSITLTGLFPYSNYTVDLAISRNKKLWKNIPSVVFQTKTSVPNSISDLEVISKADNFIALRWKEPYPPTGVLDQYVVRYHYNSRYDYNGKYDEYVRLEPCPLWNDYQCANLTKGIYKGYTYTIQVAAQNREPKQFGVASDALRVTIKAEASFPPYGIALIWTENNDMNISWYHPNVTNGPLRSFEFDLRNTDGDIQPPKLNYFVVREANFSLTYTKTIPSSQLEVCSKYEVRMRAHNIYKPSSYSSFFSTVSPPDIPPSIPEESLKFESTNTTITVHIRNISSAQTTYEKKIYVVVSKAAEADELPLFEEYLSKRKEGNLTMASSWIVYESERTNSSLDVEIGSQNQSESDFENRPLEPGTNYSVTLFLSNECRDMIRLNRSQMYISTLEYKTESDGQTIDPMETDGEGGLWALILLLVVPLALFGYWYKKNKKPKGTDLLIPQGERTKHETIQLPRMPNPGGNSVSVKPKKSLPQILPPLNTTHSKPIRIHDFVNYVKHAVSNGELESQHNLFPRGLVKPCEYGSLPENKAKNRYKNLIAYDDTRVKLRKIHGDEFSDYINANYVDGYRKPKCYIATQGPKTSTLEDFWRMIWLEKVKNIVMLANVHENGKKKVEKYWPEINEDITFGNIRVQHVSTDIFANFDIRVFNIYCNKEERKVEQLHFTTWPDHGVPLYSQSLVPFLQRILKIPYNSQSPIVVHCSAGVGRTGTIILSDICLRMAAGEGSIDFLANLENIRSQRANLVDNVEQYKLAHLVVLECLFGMNTAVPCTDEMNNVVDGILRNDGIKKQMKYIVETQWQDSAMETMLENETVFPTCPEKDRFKEIIPRHYRVFLTRYPVDDDESFYINAVLVDGFRNPGRYISTQQPMPNTLGDFWRMVVERSCTTIISLNSLNLKDETVCQFYPSNNEVLEPLDIIRVNHVKTKRLECYTVITVQVEIERGDPLSVDIIQMDNWNSDELLPNSIEEFLTFIDAAEAISRNSERVIVTCYDGATASGLYLAMTFLTEKMKLEQECDVCLAVRTIRHSRKEFVISEEQYEFLYRASVTFIAGFQAYANFT